MTLLCFYLRYFEFAFRRFSPLLALFRIWLSRHFAFIGVITHFSFELFRVYSRYYAFGVMYFSFSDTNRLSYFSFRFFTFFFSFLFFFFCFASFLAVLFRFLFRCLRFFSLHFSLFSFRLFFVFRIFSFCPFLSKQVPQITLPLSCQSSL